jgi:sulfite reductase beta subunit-like hemoprotein
MLATSRRQKGTLLMSNLEQRANIRNSRYEYLIQEFRCAVLRAQVEASDLEAIGLALKAGLVTAEQALELAAECGSLRWIAPGNDRAGAAT